MQRYYSRYFCQDNPIAFTLASTFYEIIQKDKIFTQHKSSQFHLKHKALVTKSLNMIELNACQPLSFYLNEKQTAEQRKKYQFLNLTETIFVAREKRKQSDSSLKTYEISKKRKKNIGSSLLQRKGITDQHAHSTGRFITLPTLNATLCNAATCTY